MQETRKPQKEEKRSLEKKDTENMEMKKPEEQAKPKKKKIISVVRPQNATSKEAKEFTKNQGQKKDRPSRGNGRPEGNRNGNGRSEDRPNRGNGNGGNGDRPNRNGDRPQGERRFNKNGDHPNRSREPQQGAHRISGHTKKNPQSDSTSNRGLIKYLQITKLSFFCNYFKRNFYRYFLVKFNDSFVLTNFFNLILNNDNLTIDVMTQFSQFISNLNVTY